MEIKNYIGTLNDTMINELCSAGLLVSKNYEKENLIEACYELSASSIYYDASDGYARIDLQEENFDYILIKPKQSVIIITEEELNIPNNVIARVLTKGKLFSIGLSPVNTYADPGFKGNLGIILQNNSIDYLKIKKGERIAKIEFSVLQTPVANGYSGQHGYKTKIWPVPVEFKLTADEIKGDKRIGKAKDEIQKIFGPRYSDVIFRLLGVEKQLAIATIFYFTFSILLLSLLIALDKKDWFSPIISIVAGLAANVISFFVVARIENQNGSTKKAYDKRYKYTKSIFFCSHKHWISTKW